MLHFSFFYSVEHEPFYEFQIHPRDGYWDLSLEVVCKVVDSELLMLLLPILRPRYLSRLLSLLDLSFSGHSQVGSP